MHIFIRWRHTLTITMMMTTAAAAVAMMMMAARRTTILICDQCIRIGRALMQQNEKPINKNAFNQTRNASASVSVTLPPLTCVCESCECMGRLQQMLRIGHRNYISWNLNQVLNIVSCEERRRQIGCCRQAQNNARALSLYSTSGSFLLRRARVDFSYSASKILKCRRS